ncbi:MAG: hypothetical protein PUC71_08220 [Oscillospiraceae bacterium]|nr:hypothetical protein [Oscillospiraceae bacterium]
MLGKLIKHEFIADSKLLGPAYIVILVLALLGRFTTWLATRQAVAANGSYGFNTAIQHTNDIVNFIYVLAIIALMIMTFIFLVYRFYKNFFTDEGYLMLTLPTKPRHLVFSKLLNYFIWMLFSSAMAIFSLWVIMSVSDQFNSQLHAIVDTLTNTNGLIGSQFRAETGAPFWVVIVELIVLYLAWAVQFVLICYFSTAFGQLRAKNHKVLGFVLWFIIFTIIGQVIINWYTKFAAGHFPNMFHTASGLLQAYVWFGVLLFVIISALLYWATCYIMSHKVNLD